MDFYQHNTKTWDAESKRQEKWSTPVTKEQVEKAKHGEWSIILTANKAVPRSWFPDSLKDKKILLVAGSGGQQGPLIAAAGAETTVFDASQEQLSKDTQVAEENGLSIKTIQGNMTDLNVFEDNFFDLIINPCSNCFIPDVIPLWEECYRVLKKGGQFMSGSLNPIWYASDRDKQESGVFEIIHSIPFQDTSSPNDHWEFGHSLDDLIGGQLRCGFKLVDFYEDGWGYEMLDRYINQYIATLAQK